LLLGIGENQWNGADSNMDCSYCKKVAGLELWAWDPGSENLN
jgi:hypothetical protein